MQPTISLVQFIVAVASASFATFLGSFAVEILKNRQKDKKSQSEYKVQLAIELEQLIKMMVRLKSEYRARSFFPVHIIGFMADGLIRAEERLKSLSLIADKDLQKQIYELVADCRICITEIGSTENWPLEKGISEEEKKTRQEQAREERPEKNLELSDLQRRFEEIVKALK